MKIAWTESLAVGVAEIDADHRHIFDAFSVFSRAYQEGHGADKLRELLWFLSLYVATHFAREERLMQRVGYPDFPRHHELHTGFVRQVDDLMRRVAAEGTSDDLITTVHAVIREWLLEHVSVEDRDFAEFMKAHGEPH